MDANLIPPIVSELRSKLIGRFFGKIFQLDPLSMAIDFGLRGEYLFVSVEPSSPRLYLINRRLKELEKASIPLSQFAQTLRARLASGRIIDIQEAATDRVVRFTVESEDEVGSKRSWTLIVQLTGRAANLLLLDDKDVINEALRPLRGEGQLPGHTYQLPPGRAEQKQTEYELSLNSESASSTVDLHFRQLDAEKLFDSRANQFRGELRKSLNQKRKLKQNLENDLTAHGDPEEHKRIGDLLLANLTTAVRDGSTAQIIDYYSESAPRITLEIDEGITLQEEAAQRFRQYSKAKRAREQISDRLRVLDKEINSLEKQENKLAEIIEARDEEALAKLRPEERKPSRIRKQAEPARIPGVRHYVSSDGYEILVGRAAKDNDHLTFRVARPNDLWMHAADYPGSHVIVRNPTRKEIPQRTIIEAAQLAGKFSQASEDTKVVIHYTQRKFLAKPKGAAPGLVRMSNFRSITVEPKEVVSRVR